MKDKFAVPMVFDIPIETKMEIDRKTEVDITYIALKEKEIRDRFNKEGSNIHKVGEFISKHFQEVFSYDDINKECEIKTARGDVSDLNKWSEFGYKVIPATYIDENGIRRNKKGKVMSCLKNKDATDSYIVKKSRTIATMSHVLENVENIVGVSKQVQINEHRLTSVNLEED